MSITKVTHPQVIRIAAVTAILFSLVGKISALLKSIPNAVLGGIMLLIFGTIATAGVTNMLQHKVDLTNTRNIIIFSLTLTIGIGGATFSWGELSLSGIGLAAIVGVVYYNQNLYAYFFPIHVNRCQMVSNGPRRK